MYFCLQDKTSCPLRPLSATRSHLVPIEGTLLPALLVAVVTASGPCSLHTPVPVHVGTNTHSLSHSHSGLGASQVSPTNCFPLWVLGQVSIAGLSLKGLWHCSDTIVCLVLPSVICTAWHLDLTRGSKGKKDRH